jgi:hypothetical protein
MGETIVFGIMFFVIIAMLLYILSGSFRTQREIRRVVEGRRKVDIGFLFRIPSQLRQPELNVREVRPNMDLALPCLFKRFKHALDPYLREVGIFGDLTYQQLTFVLPRTGNPGRQQNNLWESKEMRNRYADLLEDLGRAIQAKDKGLLYMALSDLCFFSLFTANSNPPASEAVQQKKSEELFEDLESAANQLALPHMDAYAAYRDMRRWDEVGELEGLPKELLLPLIHLQRRMIAVTNPMSPSVDGRERPHSYDWVASLSKKVVKCLKQTDYAATLDLLVRDQMETRDWVRVVY